MRSKKKFFMFAMLFVLIFSIGSAVASDSNALDANQTIASDNYQINEIQAADDSPTAGDAAEITVEDWDDLQYYCSLTDKDYVLKLKENTSYYPTDPKDESYQISVNNDVTIIGSTGAYFGDSSSSARTITYNPINVPENSGHGITLKGITFKWISCEYQPNAIFLVIAGNANNTIENCNFYNITQTGGHSSIVQILRGDLTLTNCSFTNVTSDYGCVSIYDPQDDPTGLCTHARCAVDSCYFEGNYARTEPGCINNCGVLVVRNTTFYRNTAFWWAGAIHTHGGANTTIYDSNFTDNVAGWNGGALYTYSYLQIYNTVFVGNNCTTNNGGGAIGACKYLHSPYIYVENSLFEDNENLCWGLSEMSTTGTGRGGAISIMDEGSLTVLNTTFIKNSASIGTAICAITQGSTYGSPDVIIRGNRFINHTRIADVLNIKLDYSSLRIIEDNYYLANSIVFSKIKLTADDRVGDEVTLHIDAALKNPEYYDSDILEKSGYDVYMDGQYVKTVYSNDFTLNLRNVEKAQVYVIPSISISKSNEVSVGLPKEYIYVSQKDGDNANNGSKNSPVKSMSRALELASATGNIIILDGTFSETNLNVNYNLTIAAEGNVVFTSKGNVFNISSADVEFKNIIFKNSKQSSSVSERIIRHSGGLLKLENCTFESNSYNTLIESGAQIEAENLIFRNNNGMLIQANQYAIVSCVFDANTATTKTKAPALIKSDNAVKCSISDSVFSNSNVIDGCIYFYAKAIQNTLTITDSTFINNVASDGCSGILMAYSGGLLDVKSSLFVNNTDSGKNGAVILTSTEVHVSDSIFLANTFENTNNALINAKSSPNLKKIYCSGNWFGNTNDDYNITPPISSSSNCDYWIFLNASANTTSIFQGENAMVTFDLNNIYNKDGNISYWDSSDLPTVKLRITTTGGTSTKNEVTLSHGLANTVFTLTDVEGSLIAKYVNAEAIVNFTEAKIDPLMNITFDESIMVDDTQNIEITLPGNATGTLTLTFGDMVLLKNVTSSKTTFEVVGLPAGQNNGVVTYSGDDYYSKVSKDIIVNVNRYNSTTTLSLGDINVGQDVVLTIMVSPSVAGNVTLIINGEETTLTLTNSRATHTIRSIARGDYDIRAVYNGNDRYSASQDSVRFEVDKLNTTVDVNVDNITYGEIATVELTLNSTATGNISVVVDGNSYDSGLENGKAIINISGLTAGEKVINVIYSGDNVFNPNNRTSSFNVARASTPLTINVNNIMIGESESIEVVMSRGVDGNVTIVCGNQSITKSVPRIGKVSWTISDLPLGKYEVAATLTSNNCLNVENSTEFSVLNYNNPQWSNEGYDVENTGKSPYETDARGGIVWSYSANGQIIGNIIIDSEGNIHMITSNGIYSIASNGSESWKFDGGNYSGLSVSRDVIIAPQAGNTIVFINQDDGSRFGNSNIYQASSLFAPVVDSNANVYVASEYQYGSEDYKLVIVPYKIWKNGGSPILISLGKSKPTAAPVIVSDEIVAVACEDGLKIININNKEVVSTVKGNNNGIRPVVGPGNMIYAVLDDSIALISQQGTQVWKTKVTGGVGKYLVLDDEIGAYSLNSNGNLYKYGLIDGTESLVSNLTFTSPILVGSDSSIYVGSGKALYAFDSNGKVLWKSNLESDIVSAPVVDKNGTIYVATKDKLYALSASGLRDPDLEISIENITAGDAAILNVSIENDARGNITVEITGDSYHNVSTVVLTGGELIIPISNLNAGAYNVDVIYSGDENYQSDQKTAEFNVAKRQPSVNVTVNPINYGEDATVSVDLVDEMSGNITVTVDGRKYFKVISARQVNFTISGLSAGTYPVNVLYSGDLNHFEGNFIDQLTVNRIVAEMNVTSQDIDVGQTAVIFVTLPRDVAGKVFLDINNETCELNVVDGMANRSLSGLEKGNYAYAVNFTGDENYMPNSYTGVIHVGLKQLNISASANDISVGENVLIDITLSPAISAIAYVVIGNESYQTKVADGRGHAEISGLNSGAYSATVIFNGSDEYRPASTIVEFNVNKAKSVINVSKTIAYYSDEFTISLTDSDSRPIANETLSININGKDYQEITDNDGRIYINPNLSPGNYQMAVNFKGNDNYSPAELTTAVNILSTIQANDMTRGYNSGTDFKAKFLDKDGNPLKNTQVKFIVNGVEYKATTNSAGIATLNAKLKVGNYKITALNTKTGESEVYKVSIVKRIVENKALTMDYLDGSRFKVRIVGDDGKYVGSGYKVTFKIGSKTYSAKTNSKGYASIKINLVPKKYTIKTTFKGYTVSNKLVIKQVLKAKNVSKKKAKSYKYSATLKTSKGKAIKGKKITFKIKGKKYVSKTNKKGVATITIKLKLKVGKYTITSIYSKTKINRKLTIRK